MTITYRIYSNNGNGGPVDFSTPLATTTELTYTIGPLGVSTDSSFVVRAYDPASGFEEANTDAQVRVVLGADGTDLSQLPNPPHALVLSPAANGGCRVSWAYAPANWYGTPTAFSVFLTQGNAVDYSAPAASVAFSQGVIGYSCMLPGPFALSTYTVAVRSFNATGVETNTEAITSVFGLPAPFAMDPVLAISGSLSQ